MLHGRRAVGATRAPDRLERLVAFSRRHPKARILLATRTVCIGDRPWAGSGQINAGPTAAYCHAVGKAALPLGPTLGTPFFRG